LIVLLNGTLGKIIAASITQMKVVMNNWEVGVGDGGELPTSFLRRK
jgi:hypothetical protein